MRKRLHSQKRRPAFSLALSEQRKPHIVPEKFYVGTAGWNIPKASALDFAGEGTHLERYARYLTAVEINTSFYRPHRPNTYALWAESVPKAFRFSVKMPREITHTRRLIAVTPYLEKFLDEINELEDKLGPILVQLPPSLGYNEKAVLSFFETIRARFPGDIVCEPRHPTWFTEEVGARLKAFHIARVFADPPVSPRARDADEDLGLLYLRLHGSPKIYYSSYSSEKIAAAAATMRRASKYASACWCIFDNTALGEATKNALSLRSQLITTVPEVT